MSLFGSIQLAAGALQANDVALQVVGQNISNANTPGYIREQAQLVPGGSQRIGNLNLGMGVNVAAIVQQVDQALEERLRGATSDSANTQTQANTYKQLESLLNSMGSNGLNTMMTSFFSSVSEILNKPEDVATRNLAALQGGQLTSTINSLAQQVNTMRTDLNSQVIGVASSINSLTNTIAQLNVQIAAVEGGTDVHSAAVGLRDQRQQALTSLSNLIGIRTDEQPNGTVNVYCGNTYLVYAGASQQVDTVLDTDRGLPAAQVHVANSDSPLDATSGQLAGLLKSRDQILGGFSDTLNQFVQVLTSEFNKVYSSGQGLSGYTSLTAVNTVDSASAPLNATGLQLTPVNGSFQILVHDKTTDQTQTSTVNVNLSGVGQQTTLSSLAAAINNISGMTASVSSDGRLNIAAQSSNAEFAFSSDNTGVLAALGLNTFFTGSSALNVSINSVVQNDPGTFAASTAGIGSDTTNAKVLASFADQPLASQNGNTVNYLCDQMTNDLTQSSSIAQSMSQGAQSFQSTLQSQETVTSGVSIDEEAVQMMTFQRGYQACAKYISTLNDLMQTLLNI